MSLVKVYNPYTKLDGTKVLSTVNWAAVGAVDTDTARKFAQELLDACDKADRLDEEYLGTPKTFEYLGTFETLYYVNK